MCGIGRLCLQDIVTGIDELLTGGVFVLGIVYDYWTANEQLAEIKGT